VVTCTIAFEENGGSAVADITQQPGSAVSAPTAPTKTGYSFVGWYSDSALTNAYTFNVMPSQNVTLYAKWQINQYTLVFDTNGGSAVTSILADYNSAVSEPTAPTKLGYTFVGWFSDSALTTAYVFSTMPLGGTTVYAGWSINQYMIIFESNGGSFVTEIMQDFNSAVEEPAPPTKLGYTFEGWYLNETLTNAYTFTTMPAENITLYAKWEINEYTITFAVDGGSAVDPIIQDYDTPVSAPVDPTKLGFIFTGWYVDNQYSALYTFDKMPAENITVYAKWEVDPLYGTISIQDFKDTIDGLYHEVAGVVLFAAGTQMGLIVITDSTGTLVVMSTGVTKYGDFVKVGGVLAFMGDYPMMNAEDPSTTLLMILDYERPIPIEPAPMTIAAYNALDPNESDTWINYLEISGTLVVDNINHVMTLEDGTDVMPLTIIDMETYLLFMEYEGFDISVRGLSIPNFDAAPVLMFMFTGNPADISLNYTDAEFVAVLGPMLAAYLTGPTYFPGQYPDLPTDHPLAPVVISYETFGPNAALYDVTKGQFSTLIDSELYIDIRATITLGAASTQVEFQLHVAPLDIGSIATFVGSPDSDTVYYYLRGVVIHLQLENNFVMIADATGIAYVITSNTDLHVGDEIIAYGIKMSSGGMSFLANDPATTVLVVLSSGNPMPLTATPITIEAFLALDVNDPNNFLVYYSVTGMLTENVENHIFFLVNDTLTLSVPVYASTEADYAVLQSCAGLLVTVSGLTNPIVDQGMILLVFINYPGDIVIGG